VIIDEGWFMRPEGMATVLPVCSNGAPLYIHSSRATDPDSPTASIANAKYEDGTDAFDKYDNNTSCPDCKRKGPLFASRCRHMTTRLPHFRKETDASFMTAVMKQLPTAYEREVLNLDTSSDRTPIFSKRYMDWMLDGHNLYQRRDTIDTFITVVDPGAGVNQSEYAVLSMAFVSLEPHEKADDVLTRCVLLGADVMRTTIAVSVASVVRRHIEEVRSIPGLRYARCVVCPEANSNDAPNVAYHLRRMDISNVEIFTEPTSRGTIRVGQNTNSTSKPAMFSQLNARLRNNAVVFHRDFCQACPELAIEESSRDIVVKHFRNGYRKVGPVKQDGTKGRVVYTGKDRETGAQDDFLMCLAMGQLAYINYLSHQLAMV